MNGLLLCSVNGLKCRSGRMVAELGKSSSHGVLCGEKYGAVLLPKESLRSVVVGESMAESSMELSNDSRSSKSGPDLRSIDNCDEERR